MAVRAQGCFASAGNGGPSAKSSRGRLGVALPSETKRPSAVAATRAKVFMKKNESWKPDGPKEYALSLRKWSIRPTAHKKLMHKGVLKQPSKTMLKGSKQRSFLGNLFQHKGAKKQDYALADPKRQSSTESAEVSPDDVQN
ncbi:hypothetical protein BS47DRAFT_1366955, partial [Hydnum rufescens UP504]